MAHTTEDLTGLDAIARLKELVEELDVAMMTTRDAEGNLTAHPVSTKEMDGSGDLWLVSSSAGAGGSGPFDVGLSYLDREGRRFASVAGRAEIVDDENKAAELATDDLAERLGADASEVTLVRVTPTECEFWEPADGGRTASTQVAGMRHGRVSC
ncbi:pyridoxamine 5'-phosphate oxidase family protein [Microbacterium jejuense]|uniref:Pyridoxamine 5'-phosphate oxidase family protein n=1 Tax=Microbacterium jejuense TaxID=1263637 RepID=A0ABS7HPV5_9MICO|nr:pyridoxamine 5'-phosphate oxidase family protein [Microbacterium jejuense]MBW9094997.1 pyridoxamine 5'-phosphate oxidase family protein [Microbacterium jejuense]